MHRLALAGLALAWALNAAGVPKWTRFETQLRSGKELADPTAAGVRAEFHAPSGAVRNVYAFWDGGRVWRVRFTPDEEGLWRWSTTGPDAGFARRGIFTCTRPRGRTVFERHGPVTVSKDRRRFAHADGTPFFWLADTAWNGPLLATDADWQSYIGKRAEQGFTAVQWVATQWRGSPRGDSTGRPAYTASGPIRVNVEFFRRLEVRHDALLRAGLLSVPVMLWSIATPPGSEVNPGVSLSERDAAVLARYMLARWGADPVVWLLNGDGDYRGAKADRWKNIGRAVFDGVWHAPVSLHPGGLMWTMEEFRDEPWLDIAGYQSSHSDGDRNSAWIHSGPPAAEWKRTPVRPVISLEGPYERKMEPGGRPVDFLVRRNHLWSMLNAPLAGITYGVHGVWGWSDGVHPAPGHGVTVWPDWKQLLDLPGAGQVARLRRVLESLNWTRLEPAPSLLAEQPGKAKPAAFVSAAQTPSRSATVAYTPEGGTLRLVRAGLPAKFEAQWVNAVTGERIPAAGREEGAALVFTTPAAADYLLLLR